MNAQLFLDTIFEKVNLNGFLTDLTDLGMPTFMKTIIIVFSTFFGLVFIGMIIFAIYNASKRKAGLQPLQPYQSGLVVEDSNEFVKTDNEEPKEDALGFCHKCGFAFYDETDEFCKECGAKLTKE